MKFKHLLVPVILFAALVAPVFAQSSAKPLTKDQVMGLAKAGMETPELVKLIEEHGIDFDPSDDYVQALRQAGAQDAVIQALRAAHPTRLTKDQVLELLTAHVPNQRAVELVAQHGIDFAPDDQYLEMLRLAGASDALIASVRKAGEAVAGRLVVETSPGAEVYLDGQLVGRADASGRFSAKPQGGPHSLRIALAGKQDFEQKITVVAGEDAKLAASLADLSAPPATHPGAIHLRAMGVSVRDAAGAKDNFYASFFGIAGALVDVVDAGGPAANAGVQPGDVIRKLNGQETQGAGDLVEQVANLIAGAAAVELYRNGQTLTVTMTLGPVRHGYIGLRIHNLDEKLAKQFDAPDTLGALVEEAAPEGPGAKAGLRAGDIIRRGNGQTIENSGQFTALVTEQGPGGVLHLDIRRAGQALAFTVTLGERPAGLSSRSDVGGVDAGSLRGISVIALTPSLRDQWGVPPSVAGVLVADVQADSPAAKAGVQLGDVIESINRQPMRDILDFNRLAASAKGDTVLLVQRRGNAAYIAIPDAAEH
jgi:S1-C subfamily serine protease